MNITKQTKQDFWKIHITMAAKHATGARSYCRENDLDHLQFYYWRNKLRKQVAVSIHRDFARPFVPVAVEAERITAEEARSLPDAEWVGRFAVQIIRGLSR
jgi:hypothetical protein